MPISPIVLQRRLTEVGRIRIGQLVPTRSGKTRPDKLDRLRYTSSDKGLLDQIAALYGGEVKAWTPQGGGAKAWEVITDHDSVPVIVPPQSVTQWMEHWSGGGAQRRCDGTVNLITDAPCECAATENMICKPTTRLSLMLRDVESIGVWRLESKGWTAAAELPGMADLLARAGGYVKARLYLKAVRQVSGGETRDFMVPALAVDGVTPAQLLQGNGDLSALAVPTNTIDARGATKAIEPAPSCEVFIQRAMDSRDAATVRDIWRDAAAAGCIDAPVTIGETETTLKGMLTTLGTKFAEIENGTAQRVAEQDTDTTADRVAAWTRVLTVFNGTTDECLAAFYKASGGREPADCSVVDLRLFLDMIEATPEPESPRSELDEPEF